MKKLILLFFVATMMLCCCACQKNADYTNFISQLRSDILVGENEKVNIIANIESRESPYVFDGEVGTKLNYVILKITLKEKTTNSISVSFCTDKQYTATLAEDSLTNSFIAKIEVDEMPTSCLTVAIDCKNAQFNVELYSQKNTDCIDWEKALSLVIKSKPEIFDSLGGENAFCGEINVRFLQNDGCNFWYVGIIDKTTTYAYLVDAKTCTIIAERTIDNP